MKHRPVTVTNAVPSTELDPPDPCPGSDWIKLDPFDREAIAQLIDDHVMREAPGVEK
jgi:hypothetical protein